jgi:uncharacterized protein involved in response to NO
MRREPFRILFPLGVILAWLAVLPWVLFGAGFIRAWLGSFHALTMTQGFLVAVAAGFLGTMIPRRTQTAPMSWLEVALCVGMLALVPVSLILEQVWLAEIGYLIVLVTLAQFAVRRMRASPRPPPPSFVFLPFGLAAGIAGALLILAGVVPMGRGLVQEALPLALALAVAPLLTPIICHGLPVADESRRRALPIAFALLFVVSFPLQHLVHERAGLLLRGLVVALHLGLSAQLLVAPTLPGLHRRLYRVALWLLPLGLLCAAARPAYRIPFLHLTFVGGLSLLVFAVSFHVVFLHTGREAQAHRWPRPVIAVGALTLLAAGARALAEHLPNHYFGALALASSLWLAGAVVWGVTLVVMVVRRAQPGSAHATDAG